MAKKKILIVDDELDVIEVVSRLLEEHNYRVLAARSGEEAIKITKKKKPDLILMDIYMPGMDGFAAAAVIKSDNETAHIPILMLTVDDSIDSIGKAYHYKIDGYVVKYLISAMLTDRIAEILERQGT